VRFRVATLAIDFNKTRATNPVWTGHARFQVVWQSVSVALLSVLELVLIGSLAASEIQLLPSPSSCRFVTFGIFDCLHKSEDIWGNFVRSQWHSSCSPDTIWGIVSIDMNFAAVIAALLSLGVIMAIY
jgi:hypothetical protein